MKRILILAAASLSFLAASAQVNWTTDRSHSSIGFTVTHLVISEVEGSFKTFDIAVSSPAADNFEGAKIEFSADVASIYTGDENRDGHLKSPDFFDAANNPKITFKSTSFKKTRGNQYKLVGDLTMHGVTKSVELTAVYNGTVKDPYGNTKAGFKITGVVNRTQFGLKWNAALETGGVVVSEDVTINCNIELKKS
ncbi:MAG: polyisoprenoid-binding protein [Bacteroidetes bacterium]|nr:MAG: polyisoprenoid-binding protein [Bacteroidota bacterium]